MKVNSKRSSAKNKTRAWAQHQNMLRARVRPAAPFVSIPKGYHIESGTLVKNKAS